MATTLTFGKYKGKTLEQVAQIDPSYLQWMTGENINRGGVNFSKLAAQYLSTHEIKEPEVCPICENTSCAGPFEHEASVVPSRVVARLAERAKDRLAEWNAQETNTAYPYDLATEAGREAYLEYNRQDWTRYPDHKPDWRWQVNCHVMQGLIPSRYEEQAADLVHAYLLETEPLARVVDYQVADDIICFRVVSVNGWGQQGYVDPKQRFNDEASAAEQARLLKETLRRE